jgi:hypothetical protein
MARLKAAAQEQLVLAGMMLRQHVALFERLQSRLAFGLLVE